MRCVTWCGGRHEPWAGRDGQGRKEGGKGYGGPSLKMSFIIKHTTRERDDIGGERKGLLVIGKTFEVLYL